MFSLFTHSEIALSVGPVIDCTLGLVVSIAGLKLLDYIANKADWVSLMHSGVYVGRRGILHWINQMIAWIVILTVTKVIVCVFMWLTSEWLAIAGAWLFEPFQEEIRLELLFVMIVFPGLMNIIYFWITDSYLKAAGHHKGAHEDDEDDDGKSVALSITQSLSMISHSHTFDMIDTGGRIREALDMISPPVADSIHPSAGYDPPPIPAVGVPAPGGHVKHNHKLDIVDTGGNVAEALGACGPSVADSVRRSSPSPMSIEPSDDPSPREIV